MDRANGRRVTERATEAVRGVRRSEEMQTRKWGEERKDDIKKIVSDLYNADSTK
jgi:hypothetical protein